MGFERGDNTASAVAQDATRGTDQSLLDTQVPAPSSRPSWLMSRRGALTVACASIVSTGLAGSYFLSQSATATSVKNAAAVEQAFSNRDSSLSRSGARQELDGTMNSSLADERNSALTETNYKARSAAAEANSSERNLELEADLEKVRAKAAQIAEEKRRAEKKLREFMERSAGRKLSNQEISLLLNSERGSLPLARGTYHRGAGFGARGSWHSYHTGIDFSASTGTPIYAAAPGIVGTPTSGSWAGNNVVLHHIDGSSTLYAHMSRRAVSPGQIVQAGTLIGYVGATGRAFGSHLHFEYYPKGTTPGDVYTAKDPMIFFKSIGVTP